MRPNIHCLVVALEERRKCAIPSVIVNTVPGKYVNVVYVMLTRFFLFPNPWLQRWLILARFLVIFTTVDDVTSLGDV